MHKFDFGYFIPIVLIYTFYGFLAGLMVGFGVGFFLDAPLWVFGLSLFFIAFHYHDMKKMRWRGRLIRYLWIVTMTAGIFGIVWFFVPKEDWVAPKLLDYFIILPLMMPVVGFMLGVLEGIKPDFVVQYVERIKSWWYEIGGYY